MVIDLVIKLFTIQNVSIKILAAQALNHGVDIIMKPFDLNDTWKKCGLLLLYYWFILKIADFFAPFDLQNSSFMWFKFAVLWGNLHRLSWAMTAGSLSLARCPCIRRDVNWSASYLKSDRPRSMQIRAVC